MEKFFEAIGQGEIEEEKVYFLEEYFMMFIDCCAFAVILKGQCIYTAGISPRRNDTHELQVRYITGSADTTVEYCRVFAELDESFRDLFEQEIKEKDVEWIINTGMKAHKVIIDQIFKSSPPEEPEK